MTGAPAPRQNRSSTTSKHQANQQVSTGYSCRNQYIANDDHCQQPKANSPGPTVEGEQAIQHTATKPSTSKRIWYQRSHQGPVTVFRHPMNDNKDKTLYVGNIVYSGEEREQALEIKGTESEVKEALGAGVPGGKAKEYSEEPRGKGSFLPDRETLRLRRLREEAVVFKTSATEVAAPGVKTAVWEPHQKKAKSEATGEGLKPTGVWEPQQKKAKAEVSLSAHLKALKARDREIARLLRLLDCKDRAIAGLRQRLSGN